MKLKRGDQIVYVPPHVEEPVTFSSNSTIPTYHPDCEFGLVWSVNEKVVFCLFWRSLESYELRTKSNTEGVYVEDLLQINTHDQEVVNRLIEKRKRDGYI